MNGELINKASLFLREVTDQHSIRRRFISNLSYNEFKLSFETISESIMLQRFCPKLFVIDEQNEPVIKYLHQYITRSSEFEGDINKGIMIAGSYGTGKSLILESFCTLVRLSTEQNIKFISAVKLAEDIRINKSLTLYNTIPLAIDDLGRDEEVQKDFGTIVRPMITLFEERYNLGSWTFATTNYNLKTLQGKYDEYTTERFIEMFNIIELVGKSRRK